MGAAPPATNTPMSLEIIALRCMSLTYRLAGFAALYLLDDAAMMALMFC